MQQRAVVEPAAAAAWTKLSVENLVVDDAVW